MVKITLTNHNPSSKYRKVLIDIAAGSCLLDNEKEISLKHLTNSTDFNHPLLSHPFTDIHSHDNVYKYVYDDVDGLLLSAIYVYSILLKVDDPKVCTFIIKPSTTFQWSKPQGGLYFSINHLKEAKELISIDQFERFVGHLARNKVKHDYDVDIDFAFEFLDDIIINNQFTLQELPKTIDGDLLCSTDLNVVELLKKPTILERFELRYINPAIGLGVYSRGVIKKDEPICVYSGVRIKLPSDSIKYVFFSDSDIFNTSTDAVQYGNLGRFINHAASERENSPRSNNSDILKANVKHQYIQLNGIEVVLLSANRDIQKDEQLLLDYGARYFSYYPEFLLKQNGACIGNKKTLKKAHRKKLEEIRIIARQGVKAAQFYLYKRMLTLSGLLFLLIIALNQIS